MGDTMIRLLPVKLTGVARLWRRDIQAIVETRPLTASERQANLDLKGE